MAVSNVTPRIEYTANGLNTRFAFTFVVPANTDPGSNINTISNVSGTASSNVLTTTDQTFTTEDVGKVIVIIGAGSGGATLNTTVLSFSNSNAVVLSDDIVTTVSNTTANITTGLFGTTMKDTGDLEVYVDGALQTYTTDYTVTLNSGDESNKQGNVDFVSAPANASAIVIKRDIELERTTDFQTAGAFKATTVNQEFDTIIMAVQDARLDTDQSAIKFPTDESPNTTFVPSSTNRANKLFAFDGSGEIVVRDDITTGNYAITGTNITATTGFTGDLTGDVTGNITSTGTSVFGGTVNLNGASVTNAAFDLTGNLTGNVTGDVTGDVTGNITTSNIQATGGNIDNVEIGRGGRKDGFFIGLEAGTLNPNAAGGGVVLHGLNYPRQDGSFNQVMSTDGAGNIAFRSIAGLELFTSLTDTPNSYTGQDGKYLKVDTANSQIVFDTLTTDDVTEGANLYYTDARARSSISVVDSGGDGSLTYNSTSGTITYLGPNAAEVRAHFSGGTGVDITNGVVSIGQPVGTTDNVTFNDMTVSGNLTVSGTTTTVNTETINLADNQILLNSNYSGSTPTENAGIEINRGGGTEPNKTLVWDETADKWSIGTETFVAGTVEANVTGNVTGDISGNVTGNVIGNVTGNITGEQYTTQTHYLSGKIESQGSNNLEIESANGYVHIESPNVYVGNLSGATKIADTEISTSAGNLTVTSAGGTVELGANIDVKDKTITSSTSNVVISADATDKDIILKVKDAGGTLQTAATLRDYSYQENATDGDSGTVATNYRPVLDIDQGIRIGNDSANFSSTDAAGNNNTNDYNQMGIIVDNGDEDKWPQISLTSYGGANPLRNKSGDAAIGGTQTLTGLSGTGGTGSSATFDVYRNGLAYEKPTSGNTDGINNAGSGYTAGDTIVITGDNFSNAFFGTPGQTPENDLTVTVDSVDGSGAITAVTFSGTAQGGLATHYSTSAISLKAASGTSSSPQRLFQGARIGQISFTGYDGNKFGGTNAIASASLTVEATEHFSTTNARGATAYFDILKTGGAATDGDSTGDRIKGWKLQGDELTINPDSRDLDFAVNGDNTADLIKVDAGNDTVTIKNKLTIDDNIELNANLDVNGQTITSSANGNVVVQPNGTGELQLVNGTTSGNVVIDMSNGQNASLWYIDAVNQVEIKGGRYAAGLRVYDSSVGTGDVAGFQLDGFHFDKYFGASEKKGGQFSVQLFGEGLPKESYGSFAETSALGVHQKFEIKDNSDYYTTSVNVTNGDATVTNSTTETITGQDASSGTQQVVGSAGDYANAEVGWSITIPGAGSGGADLVSTITFIAGDNGDIDIADTISTTVSGVTVTINSGAFNNASAGDWIRIEGAVSDSQGYRMSGNLNCEIASVASDGSSVELDLGSSDLNNIITGTDLDAVVIANSSTAINMSAGTRDAVHTFTHASQQFGSNVSGNDRVALQFQAKTVEFKPGLSGSEVNAIKAYSDTVYINEDNADIDFRVNSANVDNQIYVDGATGKLSLRGDHEYDGTTNEPYPGVEITSGGLLVEGSDYTGISVNKRKSTTNDPGVYSLEVATNYDNTSYTAGGVAGSFGFAAYSENNGYVYPGTIAGIIGNDTTDINGKFTALGNNGIEIRTFDTGGKTAPYTFNTTQAAEFRVTHGKLMDGKFQWDYANNEVLLQTPTTNDSLKLQTTGTDGDIIIAPGGDVNVEADMVVTGNVTATAFSGNGSGLAIDIGDLTDVTLSNIADGDYLRYNANANAFENFDVGTIRTLSANLNVNKYHIGSIRDTSDLGDAIITINASRRDEATGLSGGVGGNGRFVPIGAKEDIVLGGVWEDTRRIRMLDPGDGTYQAGTNTLGHGFNYGHSVNYNPVKPGGGTRKQTSTFDFGLPRYSHNENAIFLKRFDKIYSPEDGSGAYPYQEANATEYANANLLYDPANVNGSGFGDVHGWPHLSVTNRIVSMAGAGDSDSANVLQYGDEATIYANASASLDYGFLVTTERTESGRTFADHTTDFTHTKPDIVLSPWPHGDKIYVGAGTNTYNYNEYDSAVEGKVIIYASRKTNTKTNGWDHGRFGRTTGQYEANSHLETIEEAIVTFENPTTSNHTRNESNGDTTAAYDAPTSLGARATFHKAIVLGGYTDTERNAITATQGMVIWNTTNTRIEYYDGTNWNYISGTTV